VSQTCQNRKSWPF
jgi:hypothetical protein